MATATHMTIRSDQVSSGATSVSRPTIRANASILQDLKWEQRSQTQSNIQWY